MHYVLVLLTLAALALTGYSIQDNLITKNDNDAALVNVSGRQRMLLQQISALVENPGKTEDRKIIKSYGDPLEFYVNKIEKGHNSLIKGNPDIGIRTPMDAKIRPLYFGPKGFLDRETRKLIKYARKIIKDRKTQQNTNQKYVSYIVNQASGKLKYSLNNAVARYQTESNVHLEELQNQSRYIIISTIAVLVFSALAVFRPMARRVRHELYINQQYVEELANTNTALSDRAYKLASANDMLSDFAHVVSHDLKTPLRAVHNYSDFLREDLEGTLEPEQQSYLDGMTKAVDEANRLIDDMLDYSRMLSHDAPNEKIDVGKFIKEIINSFYASDNLGFSGLCPDHCHIMVKTSPILLRQIIQNLVSNAIKYNNSKEKLVEVGCRQTGDGLGEIYVKDNGIGIDQKYFDKIFDIFQRLHTKDQYSGTGIGLAIVKKAAERIGGTIRVRSEPGEGSTFYLSLPVVQSNETEA